MNEGPIRSRVPPDAPLAVNRWLVAVRCYSLEIRNLGKILERIRHCVSFQFEQGPKFEPVGKSERREHKAHQGSSPRNRDTKLSQQPRKTRKRPAITK